ncbi:MAG: hypothetical protein K6G33_00990 [Ruminococcus sp.]|uniref:hypothetical protein n=1 Tax=Ruminococcus sp. TaxID=41978 RepID=UPI0025F5458D|nr:hypothetical protein [Ruminococcus sp.]MCR5599310.1 hypothetical protein [Ruminococcus sp.]
MKKIAVILCALVLLGAGGFIFFRERGKIINGNRYGSMALVNSELYYYANHYVYKYSSGKSKKAEWADSCYFSVNTSDGDVEFNYYKEAPAHISENPYKDLLPSGTDYSSVYDDKYVYVRYPEGMAKIVVYKINAPSADNGSLEKIDEITF